MLSSKDILARFVGLKRPHTSLYDKRVIHPTRDWFVGLFLFFLIVVIGGSYSAYQFVVYRSINVSEVVTVDGAIRYNQVLVDSMVANYTTRAELFAQTQDASLVVVATTTETATTTDTTQEVASSTDEVVPEVGE